jgi:hypothetical protein
MASIDDIKALLLDLRTDLKRDNEVRAAEMKEELKTISATFNQRFELVDQAAAATRLELDETRNKLNEMASRLDKLTGEESDSDRVICSSAIEPKTQALETLFRLEKEVFGNAIVIRGLEVQNEADLDQTVTDFLSDIGVSAKPVETYFLGRPHATTNLRVIGITLASKSVAMSVLKKKKVLKDSPMYKNVYIDAKHSSSYLACERKMRHFLRMHGKEFNLTRHRNGLLSGKENKVISRCEFAGDSVKIGSVRIHLHDMVVKPPASGTDPNNTKPATTPKKKKIRTNQQGKSGKRLRQASKPEAEPGTSRMRHDSEDMEVSQPDVNGPQPDVNGPHPDVNGPPAANY